MGAPERRELRGLSPHDLRPHRPERRARLDLVDEMRHRRQQDLDPRLRLGDEPDGLAERRHEPRNLGAAAAREHDEHRMLGERRTFARLCAQFVEPLDQRMADIGARRAAEPHMSLRLERQQRQHMVDVARHLAGAPRPPGPDRRRHVIDDRQIRPAPRDPLRHLVREIRAVDDDEHVRLGSKDRGDRLVAAPDDARQMQEDRAEAHHGDVADREDALHAARPHPLAGKAGERRIRPAAFDRVDQPRAQLVAGFLADHDGDAERPLSHRRVRRRR